MERFFKPARDAHTKRGFFSYITESVYNIGNVYKNNLDKNIKIYFDLVDIPGYIEGNMYDVCFSQDHTDFKNHTYINIEDFDNSYFKINPYDSTEWTILDREYSEQIIKKHFIFNLEFEKEFYEKSNLIDFENTIGVHRRSTDITMHHPIVQIEKIYDEIDLSGAEFIFLLSDNYEDLKNFEKKYGKRLICFDETSSIDNNNPFHKTNVKNNDLKIKHIKEIVIGSLILAKTKKLICGQSNLTNFSILSNSKLNYKILK